MTWLPRKSLQDKQYSLRATISLIEVGPNFDNQGPNILTINVDVHFKISQNFMIDGIMFDMLGHLN